MNDALLPSPARWHALRQHRFRHRHRRIPRLERAGVRPFRSLYTRTLGGLADSP